MSVSIGRKGRRLLTILMASSCLSFVNVCDWNHVSKIYFVVESKSESKNNSLESVATIEPVICFSSLAKTVRHDLLKYTTVVVVLFL